MNIFVAKLNFDTREDDLRDLFQEYGEVDSVKIIMDRFTQKSKGYGFVEMPNEEEANNAIDDLNDTEFDGRTIVVKEARPKEERSSRGGYGRSGGSHGRSGGYNKGGSYGRSSGGYNKGGGKWDNNDRWNKKDKWDKKDKWNDGNDDW